MFSKLISTLTMTAMLLHSILGCCSHHAHACEHGSDAGTCLSEPAEHLSVPVEVTHFGHDHRGHAGCHSDSGDNEHRADVDGSSGMADEGPIPAPHPEGPCQQDCDGGDCSFAQSPQVKTPSFEDGRLYCPAGNAFASCADLAFGVSICRAADAGPPGGLVAGCRRSMAQVWRL